MVATRGRTFKRPWRRSCLNSKLKSSSAPIGPKDSWCFHAVGSSSAPLLGSTAAEGLPRIGRTSIARRSLSCASPQFASCSENFVIPPDVFGQTLKIFGLQAHIADDADFEAGAHGPPGAADAAARQDRHRQGGVDVAEREPAGEVRQEAVEGVAQPPAHGGEPLVAGLAAPRAENGGRPFDARPVDVALRADQGLAELPVVAD